MNSYLSTPVLIVALSFFGAVVGAGIPAFFTSRNNNKNIFINTVTTERAKWRGELRNHAAEFCKLAYGHLHGYGKVDGLRLEELRVLIRLRLNPNPNHVLDKAILDATLKVVKAIEGSDNGELAEQLERVESNVQVLLKQEWEKSKKEALKGKLVTA
jgi:hypothetical protein